VSLQYAVKDARDVVSYLKANASRIELGALSYTNLLLDANATKKRVLEALSDVAARAEPQDALILFIATHGVFYRDGYALVTHDYQGSIGRSSTISSAELLEALKKIRAQRELVILDTCHAGGMDLALNGLYDSRMTLLARNAGLHVIASSGTLETALDGFESNGLFTHVLLRGLKTDEADLDRDRHITVSEVGRYTRIQVEALGHQVGFQQKPMALKYGKDYSIWGSK
jgi:uncharacterized caspase-like protein